MTWAFPFPFLVQLLRGVIPVPIPCNYDLRYVECVNILANWNSFKSIFFCGIGSGVNNAIYLFGSSGQPGFFACGCHKMESTMMSKSWFFFRVKSKAAMILLLAMDSSVI